MQAYVTGRGSPWTGIERLVLLVIVMRADNATGRTPEPGSFALTLDELVQRTAFSRSSVKNALSSLVKAGAVSRFTSRRANGLNAPTVYQVHRERLVALTNRWSNQGHRLASPGPPVGPDLLSESAYQSVHVSDASGEPLSTPEIAAKMGLSTDEFLDDLQGQSGARSHRRAKRPAR